MKGKKNDFSMTFYSNNDRVLFLEYVHKTETAINWINKKGIQWTHSVIYERRTRAFLDRIINENNPPSYNYWCVYKNDLLYKSKLDKETAYNIFRENSIKDRENKWYYKYNPTET